MKKVLNILTLSSLAIFGFYFFIFKGNFGKLEIRNEPFILLVENGDNIKKISQKLNDLGVYKNPNISHILLRILVGNSPIEMGEYEFTSGDYITTIAKKLKNKIYYYRKVTFIEGETITKYRQQLMQSYGLIGEINEDIREGYFMPGTYNYLYGEKRDTIMKIANEKMLQFVNNEFDKIPNKEDFYLKNINEVLSLASVVEKESGIGIERKLIAGVFYNRLKLKMRLQSDPTTIYEITKGKSKLDRPLTFADLKIVGEYNTYYIKGIPIYPIASPSKDSIIAVLYPQKTDSLFFVADGNGGHNFSDSYDLHRENIKNYKQVLKEKNEAKK